MNARPAQPSINFRILGPLTLLADGEGVDLGGLRQRAVLAVLLVNAPSPVPIDRLIDAVWDDRPPGTARRQVQNMISALRRQLADLNDGSPIIVADGPSYRIRAGAVSLDSDVFAALVAEARALAGRDPAAAVARLRSALDLWRGPALLGLPGRVLGAVADGLAEQRLSAIETRVDLELSLGRHDEIVGELSHLISEHPLRERLVGQLMLAHFRAGRQADALHLYERLRKDLAEELGIDPCAALRQLHATILASEYDETVVALEAAEADLAARTPVEGLQSPCPAQLPADVGGFTGRDPQLRALDLIRAEGADAATIVALSGPAGVGKTTTAVHWGHQARTHFPDGQLFVNLNGHGPDVPMTPARALAHLLEGLGVAPDGIPADLQSAAGLYRSLLAGKRLLLVLDNARDLDGVAPLLPGSPGCMAVVTSRDQLSGLAAAYGARLVILDLVPASEGLALLRRRLGSSRVDAEPDAAEAIVAKCAGLPLALAVVAARAAVHPDFPLASLAAELGRAEDLLTPFDGGAPAVDVRAVLSWSYQLLSNPAARMFRLLGLHPGPDIEPYAAASLTAAPLMQARHVLSELTRTHLLAERSPGRFQFHDLLRAYSRELLEAIESADDREAAVGRLLDHYLHWAYRTAGVLQARRSRHLPPEPATGVLLPGEISREEATAWFDQERPVLLNVFDLAIATGNDDKAWRLAWVLAPLFEKVGRVADALPMQQEAVAAARRCGDVPGEAQMHSVLAMGYVWQGRHDDADREHTEAITLYDGCGDRSSQAYALINSAGSLQARGRFAEARLRVEDGLALLEEVGDQVGQGMALCALTFLAGRLEDHTGALGYAERALTDAEAMDDRTRAALLDNVAQAQSHLGRCAEAMRNYREALRLIRQDGHAPYESEILTNLGDAAAADGDEAAARTAWEEALAIVDSLPNGDPQPLRDRLELLLVK